MSFLTAFRDALFNACCPYSGHINFETQKYHTFNSEGLCKNKCCRYRLFENEVGAHILCWRRDINVFWFYKDLKTLSPEEQHQFNKEREEQRELKEKIRQEAILYAREIWWKSKDIDPIHVYIQKKQITPYEARSYKERILLPCYNSNGEIQSLQYIFPDGEKRFAKSAPVKGALMPIGEAITPTILICEGWATGCSLHMATNLLIIVAFSASNILAIAPFIKYKFSKQKIIYCADNDNHKIGQNYAIQAAKHTGGIVILPRFNEEHNGLTDFNDVCTTYGIEALKQQLDIGG